MGVFPRRAIDKIALCAQPITRPKMNLLEYLHRIRIPQPAPPSLDYLGRLQTCHLETVPFENLDVRAGRPILLEEPRLFRKVVGARRGGFCYELNGLFSWLLRALGYSVSRVAARVYDGALGRFGPDFDHMTLLVHLDRDYLVDVGFGDSFRQPLPLPDGAGQDVSGRYRLAPGTDGSGTLELHHRGAAGWAPQYRFRLDPQELADYDAMCEFNQSSPESSFTRRLVCTRATPAGRLTLSPTALTVTENGAKEKKPVSGPETYFALLAEHFQINLPAALRTPLRAVLAAMQD